MDINFQVFKFGLTIYGEKRIKNGTVRWKVEFQMKLL